MNAAISAIPELKIPSMVVRISGGRVDFFKGRERFLGLHNVTGRTRRKGDLIEFSAKCHSNLWESINIKGQYEATLARLAKTRLSSVSKEVRAQVKKTQKKGKK